MLFLKSASSAESQPEPPQPRPPAAGPGEQPKPCTPLGTSVGVWGFGWEGKGRNTPGRGWEKLKSRKKKCGWRESCKRLRTTLRNPREGKVGEAVVDFLLSFPGNVIYLLGFSTCKPRATHTKVVDSPLDAHESCEQTSQAEKGETQLGEVCGELEFQTSLPLLLP